MGSLDTPLGALLLLCLTMLVYITVVISGLRPTGYHHWLQEEGQGDATIGLTPQRQDMLNLDVAIIVCYRDRSIQLNIFINYMNSFLLSQKSSARIYIVEQDGKDEFNRAKLFNVGYVEAKKDYNYSCFIFHDVDLIPENPKLIYRCGKQPIHMSAYIDKFNYRIRYKTLFGGVSGLTEQQLKKVNGFSNVYWGWGGEDDDMSRRVLNMSYTINHPPANLARYTMLTKTGKHTASKPNRARFGLLRKAVDNMAKDGLSSLDYEVIEKVDYETYIWILADLKRNGKLKSRPQRASENNNTVTTIHPRKKQTITQPPVASTPECRQKQVTRTTTLSTVCDSHKNEFSNSNITAWRKHHSNLLVLQKEKAIFCFIPMAASAEWKTKILVHHGVIKEQDYNGTDVVEPDKPIQSTLKKYDIRQLSSYKDSEAATILKTHYKFAFFLNPYTKLLMAFKDTLNNTHNAAHSLVANRMLKKLKLQPPLSFERFMTYLVEVAAPKNYDIHWQRSVDMCNPCHIKYDFVGEVETLAADAACVLPHLGMSPWFPTPRVSDIFKLQEEAAKVYSALPKDILSKLEKVFGVDAAMFGYTMPGKL